MTSRPTRYLLGLGVLVVALLVGSQLSCSLMGACADWFGLPVLGFFEVLGILSASLLVYLALRFLKRSGTYSAQAEQNGTREVSDAGTNTYSTDSEPATERPGSVATPRWERLCDRLTDEEKRRLRDVLREGVGGLGDATQVGNRSVGRAGSTRI